MVYGLARRPTLFTVAKGRNTAVCGGILDVIARSVRFVLSCPAMRKPRHSRETITKAYCNRFAFVRRVSSHSCVLLRVVRVVSLIELV